jgi:hypothetical protein
MNIIIPYEKFDPTHIFFLEKRPTNFREPISSIESEKWQNMNKTATGNYTKIIYSTKYFSMNGIYLSFPIIPLSIHKNYISISVFDLSEEFLTYMRTIETKCLEYYSEFYSINKKKRPVYHLMHQIQTGNIKYYKENHGSKTYIKISGIWDTEIEYGITYKIIMG